MKRLPVYTVCPATNLPEDSITKYFVYCNIVDMQPHLSYDIGAKDLEEAINLIYKNVDHNKFRIFTVKFEEIK